MNARIEIKSIPLTSNEGCQDAALLNDWQNVGFSKDFPSEAIHPVKLLGRELIIWRDAAGAVHAWEDLCVHRGARLSRGWIKDDHVVCPYHGWEYEGSGKCTKIPVTPNDAPPKKAHAFTYEIRERYGMVWVALGVPEADVPVFPEWEDETYMKVDVGPWDCNSSAFRAMDNQLDATHFPFVHPGANGDRDKPDAFPPYTVEDFNGGLKSSEVPVFQPAGDGRGIPVLSGYTYHVFRPTTAYFSKRVVRADAQGNAISDKSEYYAAFMTFQPVDETHCVMRMIAALNVTPRPTPQAVYERGMLIGGQDRDIVETQRPERIPLELRQELHLRADLMGQRYRTWLREKGITYGAI